MHPPTSVVRCWTTTVRGGVAAGLLLAAVAGAPAIAQDKQVLVLGVDISDSRNFDPARMSDYSSPITNAAVYDRLVTQTPGNYETVEPSLATAWERLEDGKRLRFQLRDDVKFFDGSPLTAEDVKFSLDRLLNVKDQPAVYASNLEGTEIVDPHTVDLVVKDPAVPIMINLAAPAFAIYSKAMTEANGGVSGPEAETQDQATQWINQNSAGSGPYHMVAWERNGQIVMQKNPHYWGGEVPFERVVIRHIGDSAAQLLALENGDIDAAFNLTTEQLAALEGNAEHRHQVGPQPRLRLHGADHQPELNEGLAKLENRQAFAHSIDYDGIIEHLMGGNAVRPANFLPIGVGGSTEELTEAIGYREDLDKAKELLAAAGNPDGFAFDLSYANAAIVGTSYQLLAQKIQSDVARVGITGQPRPDRSGQPAHPVHRRREPGGDHLLEPALAGARSVGRGLDRAGRQAGALGALGGDQADRRRGGRRAGPGQARRALHRVHPDAAGPWASTSSCSSRSTGSRPATRSRTSS